MQNEEDLLFLALTRPLMICGVTMEAFFVNIFISVLCFITGGSLIYLVIGLPLHFAFRLICKIDHNQFRILFAWINTKAQTSIMQAYWGGSSLSPLSLKKPSYQKEYACA